MCIYNNEIEKMADILIANSSLDFRWLLKNDGQRVLVATPPFERAVLLEEKSNAIARLIIDRAMRKEG